MMPVAPKPEPPCFDVEVRQRGLLFLQSTPSPNYKQFASHAYWVKATSDMLAAYDNTCAYTGCRIHLDHAIDHFFPKSLYPQLAYEWSNYRLCMSKINQYKGQNDRILDPFNIQEGWFKLDFPGCYVVAGENLSTQVLPKVELTIEKLKLNDNQLVVLRYEIVSSYVDGECEFKILQKYYPYVAFEITRQGLTTENLRSIFPR